MTLPVPPEELRLWVGPFADEAMFLRSGRETAARLRTMCGLDADDRVLDIGCGSGRVAQALTAYLSDAGSYLGVDSAEAPIRWCREHITPLYPTFRFELVAAHNASYSPHAPAISSGFRFPVESASIDVALASSLFTHLMPEDAAIYTAALHRALRPGGRALLSHLLLDDEARRAVSGGATVFDFRHDLGPCATLAPDEPTAGLAYDERYALHLLNAAGLHVVAIHRGTWRSARTPAAEHDWLVVRKPAQSGDSCVTSKPG